MDARGNGAQIRELGCTVSATVNVSICNVRPRFANRDLCSVRPLKIVVTAPRAGPRDAGV